MTSLRARLSLGLVLSLVVVFAVQWLVVTAVMRELTESYVLSRLQHDIENILAATDLTGAAPVIDAARLDGVYQRPLSGHYYLVEIGEHLLRSRSLWDEALPLPPLGIGRTRAEHEYGPAGQALLSLSGAYAKQGQTLLIKVAEDVSPLQQAFATFRWRYALLSLAALLLLMGLQNLLAAWSLRPLAAARADVRRLETGEVSGVRESVPSEIRPLVREINRLVQVLQARAERSRKAVGNLAHGLKTPLTLLIQLADEAPLRDAPEARARLLAGSADIRARIDRELKRARLAADLHAGQNPPVAALVEPLLDTLRRLYADKALDIAAQIAPEARFHGDRQDLLELLGNLLDNACQWARGRVRVHIRGEEGLAIGVEDDGPGVAEADMAQLAQRGMRLDERRPGSGLGLAIAGDIVQAYGGSLSFARSPELGGLSVRVTLPTRRGG